MYDQITTILKLKLPFLLVFNLSKKFEKYRKSRFLHSLSAFSVFCTIAFVIFVKNKQPG